MAQIVFDLSDDEARALRHEFSDPYGADIRGGILGKLRANLEEQTCGCEATHRRQHTPDCRFGPLCGPNFGGWIYLPNTPEMSSDEGRAITCPGCSVCKPSQPHSKGEDEAGEGDRGD